MLRHARILGALLITHGVLLLLYAGFAAFAFVFLLALPSLGVDEELGDAEWRMMVILYGLLCAWNVSLAAVALTGGLAQRQLQRRWLTITAIAAGLLTVFGACTLPLALIIAVYGLIVQAHPAVDQAYRGARGEGAEGDDHGRSQVPSS